MDWLATVLKTIKQLGETIYIYLELTLISGWYSISPRITITMYIQRDIYTVCLKNDK